MEEKKGIKNRILAYQKIWLRLKLAKDVRSIDK